MSNSSSSENSDHDSDTSSTSASSSYSGHESYSNKKFKELRLRNRHYFFDKFGMCDKCQDIYWEMRHTWNDDDGGRLYCYEWTAMNGDERYRQYEEEEIDQIPHKKIMETYRKKLFACRDCPRNKNVPCSLRDLAYSRISVIIGTIDFHHMRKTLYRNFHKSDIHVDHEEYNRRVSKLPILDWMIKDLEAKPCKWECSHMRRICSKLVSFD